MGCGNLPPGVTDRMIDEAFGGDEPPERPTPEEERAEAWEHWHQRTLKAEAKVALLKRALDRIKFILLPVEQTNYLSVNGKQIMEIAREALSASERQGE